MDHDGMTNNSSSSLSNIDWKDWLMRAGMTGAVATAASFALFPTVDIDVNGMKLPSYAVIGVGAASGSLAASAAHEWIYPMIPHDAKWDSAETAALSIGAAGLGAYGAVSLFGNANPMLIAVGGGAYAAGDYIHAKMMPM